MPAEIKSLSDENHPTREAAIISDNPYSNPPSADRASDTTTTNDVSSTRAAYNVVSDTVTGVNVRGSDNKFQAKFIAVSVLLSALLGIVLVLLLSEGAMPWYAGALMGAFVGLVVGVVASGTVLMIYRTGRHLKGKHD